MYIYGNVGISICSTADTKNPYFYDDGNYLVQLFGVPERFADRQIVSGFVESFINNE